MWTRPPSTRRSRSSRRSSRKPRRSLRIESVIRGALLALAACAALCAQAQRATVTPSPAQTTDVVVLQADVGQSVCPVLANDGLRMDAQAIRVSLQRDAAACELIPFSQARVTLGRFPAGDYAIQVLLLPPAGS